MKNRFMRLFICLALFACVAVVASPPVGGQSGAVIVQPTRVYRFIMSQSEKGVLLTGIFSEGVANGFAFDLVAINFAAAGYLGMYVPPPGYTPDPSSGLVPLHRWTVMEHGRAYCYFSTYFTSYGINYYYNGIAGWVFPPGTTQVNINGLATVELHQLSVFYSQDVGYWYGYGGTPGFNYVEQPPPIDNDFRPYAYHGNAAALPIATYDPQFPTG